MGTSLCSNPIEHEVLRLGWKDSIASLFTLTPNNVIELPIGMQKQVIAHAICLRLQALLKCGKQPGDAGGGCTNVTADAHMKVKTQ